jgi:hypothetical protein
VSHGSALLPPEQDITGTGLLTYTSVLPLTAPVHAQMSAAIGHCDDVTPGDWVAQWTDDQSGPRSSAGSSVSLFTPVPSASIK